MSPSVSWHISSHESVSLTLVILERESVNALQEAHTRMVCKIIRETGGKQGLKDVPGHPLGTLLRLRGDSPQLYPQLPNLINRIPCIRRQLRRNKPPHQRREPRALAIRAHHDLQRAIAVHAPKVKVALGGHVGDVGGDAALLAELPDCGGGGGVVDCDEDHGGVVEVRGLEVAGDVLDLAFRHAESDFGVEACGGADDGYVGVGVEAVEDATRGDLT